MKKILLLTFCLVSLAGTAQITGWKNAFPGYPALPKSSCQGVNATLDLCYSDSDVLLYGYNTDWDSVQICYYDDKELKLLKKIYWTNIGILAHSVFYYKNEIYLILEGNLLKYVNNDWVYTGIGISYTPGGLSHGSIFVKKYRDEMCFFGNFDTIGGKPIYNAARWDGTNFKAINPSLSIGNTISSVIVKNDSMYMLDSGLNVQILNGNTLTIVSNTNSILFDYMFETKDQILLGYTPDNLIYIVTPNGFVADSNYNAIPSGFSTYYNYSVLFNNIPISSYPYNISSYYNFFTLLDGDTFRHILSLESIIPNDNHIYGYDIPIMTVYHNRLYVMTWIDTVNILGDTLRYIACIDGINKISGTVYNDENKNCILDNGEKPVKNRLIEITPGSSIVSTDTNGNYVSFLPIGKYTVSVDTLKYWRTTPCIGFSKTISLTDTLQSTSINNIDFAVVKTQGITDLSIDIVGNTGWRARRGFTEKYSLKINNEGSTKQKPDLKLVIPNNLSATYFNINPSSNTGNIYTWSFDSIAHDSFVQINFAIKIDTAFVRIGDTINFYASVNPILSDTVTIDNYDTLTQKVVASFDPNSKLVWPTGSDSINIIEPGTKEVEYLINFENLGNDTAYNIYILDTISTSFDVHHIKLTGSSHSYIPSVLPCNPFHGRCILKWSFNNINLPPKNNSKDYTLNRGHVGYKISLVDKLPLKTQINNTAYIYFDYNSAVITNTSILVIDTFAKTIDTSGHTDTTKIGIYNNYTLEENLLKIYPNPTNDILNIKNASFENKYITVCDMMGKVIYKVYITANETKQVDMKNYSEGLYLIWVDGKNKPVKVVKH